MQPWHLQCMPHLYGDNILKSYLDTDEVVINKDRKFGSTTEYYPCLIGKEPALFTAGQLAVAKKRAARNPEDIPGKSFWSFLGF